MAFCHEISMKTPLVLAKAMLLVLLIFSSAIETGALARTLNSMKPPPPPPGATSKVYDPNSNRPVAPSSPNCVSHIPGHCRAVYVQPLLKNIKTMGFCHEISMKTPLVLARAMLLVLLIFSSAIETGALARTLNSLKPPPAPGATTKVYDPNSNRPVPPSSPNCSTFIPGHCGGRN
ncbi:hypothetical protein NC651_019400 [Populus alba x Populus x berolinensis]|nr:hypothetical protein NC651_019400 [Populus alba x Populus x berolinensis]